MQPQLENRYKLLFNALTLAEKIGGKRDVTTQGLKTYKNYTVALKSKKISNQLDAASELEDIIGRLRANATSAVKLSGSQELKDAIALIDQATIAKDVKTDYKNASNAYEDKRTSWRYLLSATVCGYSPQETLEFSEPS